MNKEENVYLETIEMLRLFGKVYKGKAETVESSKADKYCVYYLWK